MPALGNKHECIQCAAKFYDLGKSEAICPSCGADQSETGQAEEEPAAAAKPKTAKTKTAKPKTAKPKTAKAKTAKSKSLA